MSKEVLEKTRVGLRINRYRKKQKILLEEQLASASQSNDIGHECHTTHNTRSDDSNLPFPTSSTTSSSQSTPSETELRRQILSKTCQLMSKWKDGFRNEKEKAKLQALQEPLFSLGSKTRNRTCKAFYRRLYSAPSFKTPVRSNKNIPSTEDPTQRDQVMVHPQTQQL